MSTEKQQEHLKHPVDETEDMQPDVQAGEMDEILEEDSQEFVENYIQRGGQ